MIECNCNVVFEPKHFNMQDYTVDYDAMSYEELRRYILNNRKDQAAFEFFMDKYNRVWKHQPVSKETLERWRHMDELESNCATGRGLKRK